jgi:hypothetical protein
LHTHTHTHTRARAHTRTHTHTHARARTHTHTGLEKFNDTVTSLWLDMNATIANAADGSSAIEGCGAPAAGAYTNKLVFVARGNCTYFDKLFYAVQGGARAVVVYDTPTAGTSEMNSNFVLPSSPSAPSVSAQQAVQDTPIYGITLRTWAVINPNFATAAAGDDFLGAASPGPKFFTLKCAAALDLSNKTSAENQWTQLASTGVFDTYVITPTVHTLTRSLARSLTNPLTQLKTPSPGTQHASITDTDLVNVLADVCTYRDGRGCDRR